MTMLVYVVGLPQSEARLVPLETKLTARNLSFDVIEAVDGGQGLPALVEIDRNAMVAQLGHVLSDGEVATAIHVPRKSQ